MIERSLETLGVPKRVLEASLQLEVPLELLYLATELARLPPALSAKEREGLIILGLATLVSASGGSTRLPLDRASELFVELGATEADLALIRAELAAPSAWSSVLGPEARPLVIQDGHLYTGRLVDAEGRLVELLEKRLTRSFSAPFLPSVDRAMADLQARAPGGVQLTEEQSAAVRHAVARGLSVITGGPGTGKTFIVLSLLRLWHRVGVDEIAVAAPTGKAAHRLEESIGHSLSTLTDPAEADRALMASESRPKTLHRLLGYSPKTGRFAFGDAQRLPHRVVVVDEASMIDIFLMERLLRSLRDDAQLVLLGDAEQLPSVEAGAVLRELAKLDRGDFQVRLEQSHRMNPKDPSGREILSFAQAIKAGRFEALSPKERAEYRGVEWLERADSAFYEHWFSERIDFDGRGALLGAGWSDETAAELLDRTSRARVLCLHRTDRAPTGAETVNRRLHQRQLRWLVEHGLSARSAGGFACGDLVMVQRNDYARGLFNGDQGLVLADAEGVLWVAFRGPSGVYRHPLQTLRAELTLAYALTVHKSQGSEFDHVGLLLPEEDTPLLSREILYTGVTRSRRSVTLVGDQALLEAGAARRSLRSTGVSEKLSRALGGGG